MLKNIKILSKLAFAFSVMMIGLVIANGLLWISMKDASSASHAQNQNFGASIQAERLRASLYRQQNAIGNYLLTGETRFLNTYNEAKAMFDKTSTALVADLSSTDQIDKVSSVKEIVGNWWRDAGDRMVELGKDPATKQAAISLPKTYPLTKAYDVLDEILQKQAELIGVDAAASLAAENFSKWTMLMSTISMGLIALLMAWFLARSISRPVLSLTDGMIRLAVGDNAVEVTLADRADEIGAMAKAVQTFKDNAIDKLRLEQEASANRTEIELERIREAEADQRRSAEMAEATSRLGEALKHLATGGLTVQLSSAFAPSFEDLRADFNAAVNQLQLTIRTVADATGAIDTGSREVSNSADDLSKRTEQQAAALEQTAAALDQITVNVTNSSRRADEARKVAVEANESAAHSGRVVANAVDAMKRIESSAGEISNIIGVIDEIAFQTNLLALNAGVEAARAGEAGKGFAVVAQEVRELAQRSAKAAKEIKDLIRNSTAEVDNGVKLVIETGNALQSIESYIVTVNQHMDAIATSAREQSLGLAEVNTAVNQMDQVTQQNAAMVEETSAAGATLADESGKLRELVSQFKLEGHARGFSSQRGDILQRGWAA